MAEQKFYVGIDLGGTNIAAAVVDQNGVIYGRAETKTNAPRPYSEVFDDMAECARRCVREAGISFDDIESVGVGTPGALNREMGVIEHSNNLSFINAPLYEYLSEKLNKKIYIENDANAAAWGEYLAGSGKGGDSMVLITLGTGVGGGIIQNGRLITGDYGNGAELGHTAIDLYGEQCKCGRRGCLECYASATALIRQTKTAMTEHPESDLWSVVNGDIDKVNGKTAFLAKDEIAKSVVDKYLFYLSVGVVNVVNLLQPKVVCIGGGISREGERVIAPIRDAIKNLSYARTSPKQTEAALATLGNDAGIIGAALLWKNVTNK